MSSSYVSPFHSILHILYSLAPNSLSAAQGPDKEILTFPGSFHSYTIHLSYMCSCAIDVHVCPSKSMCRPSISSLQEIAIYTYVTLPDDLASERHETQFWVAQTAWTLAQLSASTNKSYRGMIGSHLLKTLSALQHTHTNSLKHSSLVTLNLLCTLPYTS